MSGDGPLPDPLPEWMGGKYVYFGPKANCTMDLCDWHHSVYGYRPSLGANAVFCALFALSILPHAWLGLRTRQWSYMILSILGSTLAVVGYAARIIMFYNPWSFIGFMLQIVLIGTGPVFYCAALYVTLAKIIFHFNKSLSRINPKLFYWILIPCDVVALVLQATGGVLATISSGSSKTGNDTSLAGLIFQCITMGAFAIALVDYMARYVRGRRAGAVAGPPIDRRVKVFFGFMALSTLLIFVRTVFRAVELRDGFRGELLQHEELFIALESVLTVIAVYCMCIGHPGLVFGRDGTRIASTASDEETKPAQ